VPVKRGFFIKNLLKNYIFEISQFFTKESNKIWNNDQYNSRYENGLKFDKDFQVLSLVIVSIGNFIRRSRQTPT